MVTMLAGGPVPGMSHHQMLVFLLQFAVLLISAVLLGRLAMRLRMPAVVGELTAGVVLGPSVFANLLPSLSGWLMPRDPSQMHLIGAVAQLGVLLLVAVTGAHIDLNLFRRKGRAIGCVSAGSVLLPLALGIGMGFLLPATLMGPEADRTTFALFMGIAVAISALPVIAKTLLDMRLLHRDIGQLIVGSAAVSDIVGWLLLSIVSAMVATGVELGLVVRTVAYLIAVLAFAAVVARPLARWTLELVGSEKHPESGIATIVVLIVASAAGTHALGMEPILGTFLCGIVIGSLGPAGRKPLSAARPFVMSVLAPLFFATAGLQVDLGALARPEVFLAGMVILAVAIGTKLVGGYVGARMGRLSRGESLAIGAGLNARGVVEIVLATVGLQLGVLTTASYTVIILVAVVTSMMTPPMLRYATRSIPTTSTEVEREREFSAL
ncbi:cation:proton antiporter [Streptomyces sp. NPDC088755]|uniref:cation:proton antiporter n=1 Tax=Streptomyces sp. NPDC088755 TaxID=3365888 RepID=UPI0038290E9B